MKQCLKCGNHMDINSLFCNKCGTKNSDESVKKFCYNCGKKIDNETIFCTECGIQINESTNLNTTTPIHQIIKSKSTFLWILLIISLIIFFASIVNGNNKIENNPIDSIYSAFTAKVNKNQEDKDKEATTKIQTNSHNKGIIYGLNPYGDGFLSIRDTVPRNGNSHEIGRLYNGDIVNIVGKFGSWYKIKLRNTNGYGYIKNTWVKQNKYIINNKKPTKDTNKTNDESQNKISLFIYQSLQNYIISNTTQPEEEKVDYEIIEETNETNNSSKSDKDILTMPISYEGNETF